MGGVEDTAGCGVTFVGANANHGTGDGVGDGEALPGVTTAALCCVAVEPHPDARNTPMAAAASHLATRARVSGLPLPRLS